MKKLITLLLAAMLLASVALIVNGCGYVPGEYAYQLEYEAANMERLADDCNEISKEQCCSALQGAAKTLRQVAERSNDE